MNIPDLIQRNLPALTSLPIEPEAYLRDLGADPLTNEGIAIDLSEIIGRDIPDAESAGWETVADVMASAMEKVND